MLRYYFDVRWPDRKDDDQTGMVLADDAAARDHAEHLIREMKEGDGHDPGLTMGGRQDRDRDFHYSIPIGARRRRLFLYRVTFESDVLNDGRTSSSLTIKLELPADRSQLK